MKQVKSVKTMKEVEATWRLEITCHDRAEVCGTERKGRWRRQWPLEQLSGMVG